MATLTFVKFLLVSYLVIQATAAPSEQPVKTSADGEGILAQNLSGAETFLKHVKRRSTMAVDEQGRSATIEALEETGKLIRMAAMLPPEALQLVRKIAVPLLNTTLAVPANVLEGAANMSMEKARSSGSNLWRHLAHFKHKHFLFHKHLTLGPLSLKKTVEIGTPNVASEILPSTTPAPVVVAESAPPPAIAAVTESPAPPVAAVPCTHPPAIAAVTESPAPPVAAVPCTHPPAIAAVTESPAAPVAAVPCTHPPLAPVVAETPAPPAEIPLAPPVAVPVIVNPPPPNGGSTSQIAIVQQSPAAENTSGDSL